MSCNVCHQHEADELLGRDVRSRDLREDCNFCNILRKCCEHFSSKGGDLSMHISCGRYRQDVQICIGSYMATENSLDEQSTEDDSSKTDTYQHKCEELHVQVFSKGLLLNLCLRLSL